MVLAFVSNDIYNNHPAYGGRDLKPFYALGDNGDLVLENSFKDSPTFLGRLSPGLMLNATTAAYPDALFSGEIATIEMC